MAFFFKIQDWGGGQGAVGFVSMCAWAGLRVGGCALEAKVFQVRNHVMVSVPGCVLGTEISWTMDLSHLYNCSYIQPFFLVHA